MEKQGLIKKITKEMELPADALKPAPRIVISGNEEVLLGGHVALLEYSPELLRAQRGKLTVSVKGRNLEILSMDALGICVGGVIEEVSFEA